MKRVSSITKVYGQFRENLSQFPVEFQLDIYRAISNYIFLGTEPELSGEKAAIWVLFRDFYLKKYLNRGGGEQ